MDSMNILRGDAFENRYRIEGTLRTTSPLHIGNGNSEPREGLEKEADNGKTEKIQVTSIERDFSGKPYIPGSTLRGKIRHWLLVILKSFGPKWASDRDYEKLFRDPEFQDQRRQIEFMRNDASVLERLFGSAFSNSKIDFWDAFCITDPHSLTGRNVSLDRRTAPYWIAERLTYVGQSVAIDPETGTALDKKLYHLELVPEGIQFKLVICGQNLSDLEVGLLLFALKGFNSFIFPLTLGAMTGRGFGHMNFELNNIYRLKRDQSQIHNWLKCALDNDAAGFEALDAFDQTSQDAFINSFKAAFLMDKGEKNV